MDRDLRIRLLFETLDRVSKPLREISAASNRTSRDLGATREKLAELKRTARDVGDFRALKGGLSDTEQRMESARARATALGRELAQTAAPTRKLTAEFNKAKREAEGLETQHRTETRTLGELRSRLSAAGIETAQLAQHERRLRSEISATTTRLDEQTRSLARAADRRGRVAAARGTYRDAQDRAGGALAAGSAGIASGVASAMPLVGVSRAAMDFESVMADVRKVVNFDKPKQFDQMREDIIALSTRLPMVPEEIAKIVAAGGQASIPRGELLAFAEDATKMGVAFDMTADEAGSTMAKWRNAFQVGRSGVVDLANKVNLLGNSSGAGAAVIADIVTRVGPLGKVAGVASGEIAALGATMNGAGVEAEIAATGIKNTMLALTKGEAATKSQSKAFKSLGLDAVKVSKDMQRNASATITDVLKRLAKLPKDQQAGMMTELFGSESVAPISSLLTSLPKLEKNLAQIGDKTKVAGSMQAEYAARAATTANEAKLASNNFQALKITLGTQLLPTITALAKGTSGLLQRLRGFAQAHPDLARFLAIFLGGIAALMVAIGALAFVSAGLIATMAPIRMAASLLGMGVGPMLRLFARALFSPLKLLPLLGRGLLLLSTTAMRAGAMLLANPVILAIVALVAALAVAGYLIWKHWDTIKAAFFGAVAWMAQAWAGLKASFAAGIAALVGSAASLWGRIKALFSGGIGGLAATLVNFNPVGLLYAGFARLMAWLGVSMPTQLSGLGRMLIQGLINGITGMLGSLKNAVVGAASSAATWFKQKLGIRSPSRVFMGFGGFMMTGLGRGIEQGAGEPLRQVAALARRVTRGWTEGAAAEPPALRLGELAAARIATPAARPNAMLAGRPISPVARLGALTGQLTTALAIGAAAPSPAVASRTAGGGQSAALAPAAFGPVTITITTMSGQSPTDIADEVRRVFEDLQRQAEARARSSFRNRQDQDSFD